MTLHDIATQVHQLTLGGFVNGEKYTRRELERTLGIWLDRAEHNAIPNTVVFELCLQDGRWLCTASKVGNMYDYYIPDTREDERRIWDRLVGKESR